MFLDCKLICLFWRKNILPSYSEIQNRKKHHMETNMIAKKLYFVERYIGQFIENLLF